MKKWVHAHPKGFWGSLIALIVVVILVGIGLWHNHTQQLAMAKVDQALTTAERTSRKLDVAVVKRWAKPNVYIKTSTTAQQLKDLSASGKKN